MRNIIIPLLLLFFLDGCSTLDDQHRRRIAEVNLVQAEANFLNRCSSPKLEGLSPCVYPGAWPYNSTAKVGEVPSTQFSLVPSFDLSTLMTGGIVGGLPK